jgi:alpha-L-fucosidase
MVWWDGACGEGPNGKRQEYDWDAYLKIVRELAPDAVIFSDRGDVRWVGNEDGLAQETCWSLYDPSSVSIGGGTQKQMGEGNPTGDAWAPAECDVSIRPGWFYHSKEDSKVKTLSHLLDIYYRSVGHNCCLHLNVPPDRRGLLHENDVARLKEFNHAIKENFKTNLAADKQCTASAVRDNSAQFTAKNVADANRKTYWSVDDGQTQATIEIDLGNPTTFDLVLLQEYIELGQRISGYHLDVWNAETSEWKEIAKGTTIGYKWILRVPETTKVHVPALLFRASSFTNPVINR